MSNANALIIMNSLVPDSKNFITVTRYKLKTTESR